MYNYLVDIYATKIENLVNQEIKRIKQSDEYVTMDSIIRNAIITTTGEIGVANDYTPMIINRKFLNINRINSTYSFKNFIYKKIKAILSTLADSATFEELTESVESKLGFNELFNLFKAGKSYESYDLDEDEFVDEDDE
jgi:hypothetical protein